MESKNLQATIAQYDDFVGRRALVNKIYARIGASRPQSVSLVGDSRIGKSSLLWFLAHEKTRKQFLTNPADYIYLHIPCRELEPTTLEVFTKRLYEIFRPYAVKTQEKNHRIFDYDYYKHQVESLHKDNKKIILFLDDFNLITLNEAFPLEFFSFLRSLANNYNMAYVTTSYEDLQKLCVSKDIEESPFFNIFTNMSLRGFEDQELEQFFAHICSDERKADKPYQSYIVNLAGRFPYPLKIASRVFKENTSPVSAVASDLENRLYEELQEYYQTVWEQLDEDYRSILKNIITGKAIPNAQQYLLRDLYRKNLITMNGENVEKIDGMLFRHFVARRAGGATTGDIRPADQKHGFLAGLRRFFGLKPRSTV